MLRKIFFIFILLGLALNAVLDYRTFMETSFPTFTENSKMYQALSIVDIAVMFVLAITFWQQWRENLRIESRMSRSIAEISKMNQKLRAIQDDQTKRFKNIVHDIKNPLGVIKGFAGLIQDESSDRASIAEMSQIVERVSNEAILLVQELLVSNPEKRERIEVDLVEKINGVCKELHPIASKKNQVIEVNDLDADLQIFAAEKDIESVLHNLIGNALKFSPSGGKVFISAKHEGPVVSIQIKDSGPGFSDSDLKNIFQPDYKLSAKPTGDELSSRVGLVSVKKILDDYSAKINFANAKAGAEITVQFPTA